MRNDWKTALLCEFGANDTSFDCPMAEKTTMKVGGPADAVMNVKSERQLKALVTLCKKDGIPLLIMGNGSNLLVRDGGIRGVVAELGAAFSDVRVEDRCVYAKAGAMLSAAAQAAAKAGLTGLEFAAGIPGSVGGGVFMNAGAYGGEIKDVLKFARVLDADGQIHEVPGEELQLGYRTSSLQQTGGIVLEACFGLEFGDEAQIRDRMSELAKRRREKQPLDKASCGSTFKRPEGYFAGALIEEAGMKGASVGPAQVSPMHAGFVVNNGGATAAQVLELIEKVRQKVLEKSGVTLQCEVRIVGEDA